MDDRKYSHLPSHNDANEYARAFLYEEGKAEANRYYFDKRTGNSPGKHVTSELQNMNYQQVVDYFATKMRNDTPSGQSNLTYWQVGKALYMKEDFNILAKSPEKKALLDIGKNEGEYFEPRHLIGFGDERVRMREMPSGANPKHLSYFIGDTPSFTIFVVPKNTRLPDGTITGESRVGLYVSKNTAYGPSESLEFGIGEAGKNISFANNWDAYAGVSHSVTIASHSRIQYQIVNKLADAIKNMQNGKDPATDKNIESPAEALAKMQEFFNSLGIPINLQGTPEELMDNLDKIADDYVTPLVVDLDGNGIETTSLEDGVQFDIDGDGNTEHTAWIKSGNGFLVWDKNQDGTINDGSEMFGEGTVMINGKHAENGVAAILELDSNHDRILNNQDDVWGYLQIWHDDNTNGITENGELASLFDWGIQSLALSFEKIDWVDENGNKHIYLTEASKENGENISVADIDFRTDNGIFGKYAAALHQSDKNIFNEYSNIYEKQQTILPEPYPIV